MLNAMPRKETYPQQELAERLVHAMEEADVNLAELARGCNVTIQAVYDWRLTGRIGKHHLMTICRLTKKPLEYFLVGLGRAAAIACVALLMALSPNAEASTLGGVSAYYVKRRVRTLSPWRCCLKSIFQEIFGPFRTVRKAYV
jgi:hypothetical protein